MNMKVKKAVIATLLTILLATTAYATTQLFSFYQTLTVPSATLEFYRADGVTKITSESNQSEIWSWNEATKSFNATIYIKNVGHSTIGIVTFNASELSTGWTFSYTGNLTNIAPGETRMVQLSVANPNAVAGDSTGEFYINAEW